MKNALKLLLVSFMLATICTTNIFADTPPWQGDSGGEVLSGKGGSYIITGGASQGGGAYSKEDVGDLLEDGIEEELKVFVDVDGMLDGEFYEISVSVKDSLDNYKTEQVIMLQKTGGVVRVSGNGIADSFEIEESDIYNIKWNFDVIDTCIYATVQVSDLRGNVIGTLQSDKLINADTSSIVHYNDGDHLGYLWILNIHTSEGVHIYENVDCLNNYVKNDWILDGGATIDGSDKVYTIHGNSDSGVYSYANVSKQVSNGFEESLNFFINLDEMAYAELFETSVGIKNVSDAYKTEQVVMIQKTDDNKATLSANGITKTIEIEGSRLYTLNWNFYVESNRIKCRVDVYKENNYIDCFESDLEDAVSGDHLGYVWIFNTQVANGVHVYSEIPEEPVVKFVNLSDYYYVGDEVVFDIETVNSRPQIMVKGIGELTGDDCVTLQYLEGEEWKDFPEGESSFGPINGFPFMSISSSFKAKFVRPGQSNYVISIVDVKTGEVLCQTQKTITVNKKKANQQYKAPVTGIE